MASQVFLELKAQHERLYAQAILGAPPKDELKNFWKNLNSKKRQIVDREERSKVEYYISYWKGFLRQSGEYEVLTSAEAERRRPKLF